MPRPPLPIPHDDLRASTNECALPEHVEQSVEALAEVQLEHYRTASRRQRFIDRITDVLARPASVIGLGMLLTGWAILIAGGPAASRRDAYAGLELTAAVGALIVAVLILVTQTREDRLAQRREQLTLELALIADKRLAKLIELVEDMRCGATLSAVSPRDAEAQQMSQPVDANRAARRSEGVTAAFCLSCHGAGDGAHSA